MKSGRRAQALKGAENGDVSNAWPGFSLRYCRIMGFSAYAME
jgi:hypothetical protein